MPIAYPLPPNPVMTIKNISRRATCPLEGKITPDGELLMLEDKLSLMPAESLVLYLPIKLYQVSITWCITSPGSVSVVLTHFSLKEETPGEA